MSRTYNTYTRRIMPGELVQTMPIGVRVGFLARLMTQDGIPITRQGLRNQMKRSGRKPGRPGSGGADDRKARVLTHDWYQTVYKEWIKNRVKS